MKKYAVIRDGYVFTITETTDEGLAAAEGWIPAPEGIAFGWKYVNGQFIESESTNSTSLNLPTKEQLMAELAALTAKINAME